MNDETLYPTMPDLSIWQSYLDLGFHLFPINPYSGKNPYSAEIFELPEEIERRQREEAEELADFNLLLEQGEQRKQARQKAQRFGHGMLDATDNMGTAAGEVGSLSWLLASAVGRGGYVNENGTYRRGTPQIGCATEKSGLLIIDLDVKVDFPGHFSEAPSFQTLRELEEEYGELPRTFMVKTPRGGQHLYFRGAGKTSAGVLGRNIDTRSIGGYIILPPSVCGIHGMKNGKKLYLGYGRYTAVESFDLQDVGIADVPAWVLDVLDKKHTSKLGQSTHKAGFTTHKSHNSTTTGTLGDTQNTLGDTSQLAPWDTYENKACTLEDFDLDRFTWEEGQSHSNLCSLAGQITQRLSRNLFAWSRRDQAASWR